MNDMTTFERRLAALINAYAERAPVDADPLSTARLAAAMWPGRRLWLGAVRPRQRVAGALILMLALWAALAVTALLVGGRPVRHDPATILGYYGKIHLGWAFVYADGRVLLYPDSGDIQVRGLSARGLQDVRSGALPVSAFVESERSGNPLPSTVWADLEYRVYAPERYAVCAWSANSLTDTKVWAGALPAAAQTMLRGRERSYAIGEYGMAGAVEIGRVECFEVTPAELDTLHALVGDAGPRAEDQLRGDVLTLPRDADDANPPALRVFSEPILPHGTWQFWAG